MPACNSSSRLPSNSAHLLIGDQPGQLPSPYETASGSDLVMEFALSSGNGRTAHWAPLQPHLIPVRPTYTRFPQPGLRPGPAPIRTRECASERAISRTTLLFYVPRAHWG
jgi:hypothetical protein